MLTNMCSFSNCYSCLGGLSICSLLLEVNGLGKKCSLFSRIFLFLAFSSAICFDFMGADFMKGSGSASIEPLTNLAL